MADFETLEKLRPCSDSDDVRYIYVVSDGTAETAAKFVRALVTQFSGAYKLFTRRYAMVNDKMGVDKILNNADKSDGPVFVAYTLVNSELCEYLRDELQKRKLRGYDLFTSFLSQLSSFLGAQPAECPDKFHGVDDAYFRRIAAIEFTLNHDDGKLLEDMDDADIVLVGASRTGKTPLSMYLSLYGYKVVNVPLAKGVKPPEALEQIDQAKIVALTIDPSRLFEIRKKRLTGLKVGQSEYSNPNAILEEIEEINRYFRKHRRWSVIDVTTRSIEETTNIVRDKVFGRDRLLF